MNEECFILLEGRKCVEICGRVICDDETVKEYVDLCERCNKGENKACFLLHERYGCMSISGWWI